MSYIDNRVKEIIHSAPPWKGFVFKVTETDEGIFLMVSLDEFAKYPQEKQEDLSAWMAGMCNKIRGLMIPCYISEWKR